MTTFDTLEDVIRAFDLVEIIVQDEYTHDVVTVARDGTYHVFDST